MKVNSFHAKNSEAPTTAGTRVSLSPLPLHRATSNNCNPLEAAQGCISERHQGAGWTPNDARFRSQQGCRCNSMDAANDRQILLGLAETIQRWVWGRPTLCTRRCCSPIYRFRPRCPALARRSSPNCRGAIIPASRRVDGSLKCTAQPTRSGGAAGRESSRGSRGLFMIAHEARRLGRHAQG
jgi:hypothetical protein